MPITLSDSQKEKLDKLLAEKVPAAEHQSWRHHIQQSWDNVDRAFAKLRRMDSLPEFARPTEEGLYRNPETGELYRLKKQSWDLIVSKYEHTDRDVLRMTESGEVVKKGKWKRMNAFQSRMFLPKMRASWLMSDEDKIKYRYAICLFCTRGLEDARSVYHNYGPVCAERNGLPWGDLPASPGL